MKSIKSILVLIILMMVAACSTNTPGGKRLYDNSEPPKLLDAEIRMETLRRLKGDTASDIRFIRVKDGVLTCSLKSRSRKLKGEGAFSVKDYAEIWRIIDDLGGFEQKSITPDPSGGFYHSISFRLGNRRGQTSAQDRSNFLGLGTSDIKARLKLSNTITRKIEASAALEPWIEAKDPVKP